MVITRNITFQEQTPINLYQELGQISQNQLMIRNMSGSGNIYIGDENLTEFNSGMILTPYQQIFLPFLNLSINSNLYILGDINSQVSIMTWQAAQFAALINENIP